LGVPSECTNAPDLERGELAGCVPRWLDREDLATATAVFIEVLAGDERWESDRRPDADAEPEAPRPLTSSEREELPDPRAPGDHAS
jgi:hypothetical protein